MKKFHVKQVFVLSSFMKLGPGLVMTLVPFKQGQHSTIIASSKDGKMVHSAFWSVKGLALFQEKVATCS